MLFTAVYLANLLCTFYNCQYLRPAPVTSAENSDVMQLTDRVGRSYEAPDPIVNTTQGMVEGYMMGVLRRKIYAFEGIPYAEKPEIFADPVPKRRWSGVRSAKKISNECMQFNLPRSFRVFGELDCLQLNIYTPQVSYRLKQISILQTR
ncbi:Esterase SG1 [Orchesella cincta]|uniref:Esterase SG1 n=1 Tax=Orchesella cincta TaxID=48709 RepID=A0A1D2MTX3_ORCCI|nr:Esterase SG1 [Orchesella cincta]